MKAPLLLAALGAAALLAQAAAAQEIIQAGPTGAPPAGSAAPGPLKSTADPDQSPAAIGAWANGVMAHAADPHAARAAADRTDAPADASRRGCEPPPDRKPHGEIWGGIGTHGYREGGAAVTAPLGDCGSATIIVDETRGPRWRGR